VCLAIADTVGLQDKEELATTKTNLVKLEERLKRLAWRHEVRRSRTVVVCVLVSHVRNTGAAAAV
jgi:hypothetical protein